MDMLVLIYDEKYDIIHCMCSCIFNDKISTATSILYFGAIIQNIELCMLVTGVLSWMYALTRKIGEGK